MITETYNKVHSILTAPDVVERLERERSNPLFGFIDKYMVGCEHVNYHHEGDVWVHTKMVVSEIAKDPKHDYLDVAAALLHDIGKKDALSRNNGKNMAGHELFGLPLAYDVLHEFDFSQHECDVVMWMVENHTKANELPKTKSKYSCWKFVTHPWFERVHRLAIADSNSTIGADGNPVMNFDEAVAENPVAAYCMSHSMPSPLVTWADLRTFDSVSNIKNVDVLFELYDLCHKIQINGNANNRVSIMKSALKCIKEKI